MCTPVQHSVMTQARQTYLYTVDTLECFQKEVSKGSRNIVVWLQRCTLSEAVAASNSRLRCSSQMVRNVATDRNIMF